MREWDAVASFESDAAGDEGTFAALADGTVLHLTGADVAAPAARALAGELDAPYKAFALRRDGATWAVGAVAIEVAELPADTHGEELMLTVTQEGERALEIDGRPAPKPVDALEGIAGGRFAAYVLRAVRLHDRLWEIEIDPL
ncbi:MAG TPA: hypothetical protein VE693_01630 [Gaiellaceae bacterium]|nr:hypothetical protein [Gaiellaceae bacterium]